MAKIIAWVHEVRKFLAATAAGLSALISLGVLHGTALRWAVGASVVIGAVLVHRVPNRPRTTP